jgi:FkbM family methyltransferase
MQSYSQFGEDILLWQHFRAKPDGFFVEIGANHPTKLSQTWLLEQQGWSGILIEPLASKCELLRSQRPRSKVIQAAMGAPEQRGRAKFIVAAEDDMLSRLKVDEDIVVGSVEDVEVRTLDDVLTDSGHPKIDLLSIDVEGLELDVLRGFNIEQSQPGVILIEDHLQRLSVHRHVVSRGYRLVKRTGCNNWYVPNYGEFNLSTPKEKFRLWKEIHLDTPIRCARFYFKKRRWCV